MKVSNDVLFSYEELIAYMGEVQDALAIIHEMMNRKLDLDTNIGKYEAQRLHNDMLTLFSMVMHRVDSLVPEHREIAKEYRSND